MKFIPVREMRTHYNKVMEQLRKEKRIILTNKGKPVALLTEMNEDNFEEQLTGTVEGGRSAERAATYTAENPEILKAWIAESERRFSLYLSGKVKTVPALEALDQIRKKHGK